MTISNAGKGETGWTHQKAGDQTGKEWQVRTWYNRPWKCVLRYPVAAVARDIATLADHAAKNDNIGYDQTDRGTFWKYLKKARNFDPANIKTKCEADCSSGVAAIVKAAGYRNGYEKLENVSVEAYTGNLRAVLKAAGFEVLTASKYLTSDKYLKAGDILLNDAHHVAINLTNGSEVKKAAESNSGAKKSVTAIAKEVIDGKWGNGETRKKKLKAAGYDYAAVQKKVNELLKK